MSQEEFDQLVAARSEAMPAAGLGGGGLEAEQMITCPYWTENAGQRGMQRGLRGLLRDLGVMYMMNHEKEIGMRIVVGVAARAHTTDGRHQRRA